MSKKSAPAPKSTKSMPMAKKEMGKKMGGKKGC